MILAFKPQFEPKINSGSKIHTVRTDFKKRWNEGNTIQFATGVRTKNYNCFKLGVCSGTQPIYFLCKDNNYQIMIENKILTNDEIDTFSINDGFENKDQMWGWFIPLMTDKHCFYDGYLEAKIIHWTNLKYPTL